jgi:hypothetical protein
MMNLKTVLTMALAGSLFLAGCGSVRIGQINADPARYRNRTVNVTGTVTNSVGVLGTGGYQIEDESGKIYVVSTSGVPSRGARVTVKGTVIPGAQVLGQSVGVTIREHSHRMK